MIPRYSRPEMAGIFAPETKLGLWLDVEMAVARAMAAAGSVPADAIERLGAKAAERRERLIDPARVEAIEAVTRHDVIAFLTHVEEVCGEEARFLHLGMTSSDLLDTTLALQLREAGNLIVADLDALVLTLARRAREHSQTLTVGRSHGIHAEPTTFGLKLASFAAEFARAKRRMRTAIDEIATCAVSGAVGTFANIDPDIEAAVAAELDLRPEPVSTQVIPRDRHAAFVAALALVASSIERLATEVRHLQRTELREAEEFFHAGQKGSSAMPHKRNPVLSENLTGLARMIRAAAVPAFENVALWHERDISHSSVERVMLPDALVLTDFALNRLNGLMARLTVYPERMAEVLAESRGLHNSQRVLLALIESGLPRQEAYAAVQRHAMRAWAERRPLLDALREDEAIVGRLSEAGLEDLFDDAWHVRHAETILARVLDGHDGVEAR